VTGSSDERTLAAALAALDDAGLAHVFTLRGISPDVGWHDLFDAAAHLLSAGSIDRVLIALPRELLTDLTGGVGTSSGLRDRMLLRPDGTPYTAVGERLSEMAADAPASAADGPAPASDAPVDAATDDATAAAAERAFTAVGSLTDLLMWTLSSPLGRTGAGPVGVADRRRLVEAGAVDDTDDLEDLIGVAADAGLLRDVGRAWQATTAAEHWMGTSTRERWGAIATAFVAALPHGIRTPGGGYVSPATWPDAYPLDAAWPDAAERLLRRARRIGIVADGVTEPPWSGGLRENGVPDLDVLAEYLPTEIDKVYLQADLTAIAPGPLVPALEKRLRTMAVRESRAQASTYRFSADSIAAAVAIGETGASLREFLGDLSLTGIPQPLAYLIDRADARHGQLRVAVDEVSGRTTVSSDDTDLLATVAVDQALRPAGLVPHEGLLVSRASRDAVYWSLADARYPVVAVGGDGAGRSLSRHGAPDAEPAASDPDRYARLIAELRSNQGPDAEAAWLERELEQAVRSRSIVEVDVRLPDGSIRTFSLEATGLGGGRLRGRDRNADVERTLPLSSIQNARPI
jgi:hypothetical protein